MGIYNELKNLFLGSVEDDKGHKRLKNIIILGILGILLLFIGNIFSNNNDTKSIITDNSLVKEKKDLFNITYEEKLAYDLEEIISLIEGVGKVKVKVYAEVGSSFEYEYDQQESNRITNENDQNGGERQIEEKDFQNDMVIITDAEGNEIPVVRRERTPLITGVLIVAQGAEKSNIKYEISKAVSSLLNLPIYKISVLPYERG